MCFEAPTRIRLHAGEALRLPVDRQAAVQVVRGSVLLCEAPTWIGEQMLFRRALLDEGQAHRFAQAGWIEIVAQRDAELLCHDASRPVAAWLRACWQGLRLWRGTAPGH